MGWFADSAYPGGKQPPVAYIASIHEFGWVPKGIPPRLGLRTLSQEKRGEWANQSAKAAKIAIAQGSGQAGIMAIMAQVMAGDMRAHIAQVTEPPLARSTVAARLARLSPSGRRKALKVAARQEAEGKPKSIEKPLVDTGLLLTTLQGRARPATGEKGI